MGRDKSTEPFAEVENDVIIRQDAPCKEESASMWSRWWFTHIKPLMNVAIKEVITENDIDSCHSDDRSNLHDKILQEEWSKRASKINKDSYLSTVAKLEKADKKNKLMKKDAWATLRKRTEAGEFTSHKDMQFFQEAVKEIVTAAYVAADPNCPLCMCKMCPLPDGPKIPGIPDPSESHRNLESTVNKIYSIAIDVQPSLMGTVISLMKGEVLKGMVYGIVQGVSAFSTVFLLPELIKVLSNPTGIDSTGWSPEAIDAYRGYEPEPLWKGYVWAAVAFVTMLIMAFAMGQQYLACTRIANAIRAMLATAIHRKSLRLSTNGWQNMGGHGKIFNLLNTDTDTIFMQAYSMVGFVLYLPVQMLFALGYLGYLVTWPVLAAVVVLAIGFRYNHNTSKSMINLFVARMVKSDARVKKQHELLENIRGVKYFGWEDHFMAKINEERSHEVHFINQLLHVMAKLMFSSNLGPFLLQVAILAVTAAWDESRLTVTKVFQIITLCGLMRIAFTVVPMMYSQYLTAKAGFLRIQDFLMKDEREQSDFGGATGEIIMENANLSWARTGEPTLKNINLRVKQGELVMVVGKVGSGKSSLLEGMLGEMNTRSAEEGKEPKLQLGGRIAYCPQSPWVFNATVKQNVLWRRKDPEGKYDKVVHATELVEDLKSLPHGDRTEIGEKGINLSGGQKARVALARAVFTDADVYLLDDCLSAVDAYVGKKLFDNVITGMLKHKTRVLVTNQLQYITKADRVFSMKGGELFEEDMSTAFSPPADPKERTVLQELLVEFQNKVESQTPVLRDVTITLAAAIAASAVVEPVLTQSAVANDSMCKSEASSVDKVHGEGDERNLIEEEEVETGDVTWQTYRMYLGYFGGCWYWFVLLFMHFMANGLERMSFIWLGWYADEGREQSAGWYKGYIITGDKHTGFWLGIYLAFLVVASAFILGRELLYANRANRPSQNMCADHMQAIVRSPMSFFDTTPSGRIITRFTFDWMSIDMMVPMTFGFTLAQAVMLVTTLMFIILSVPHFSPAMIILFFAYWYVTRFDRASLQLRRIYNKTKSPVTDVFSSALYGLSSIRAFQRQQEVVEEEFQVLDVNTAAFTAERNAFEWVRLRVNLVGAFVVGVVFILVLIFRDDLSPATVGLIVGQATSFTTIIGFTFLTRQQCDMAMNSVERILHHCKLPAEEGDDERAAALPDPQGWPTKGDIAISSLSVRYRPGLPLVLRDVNLKIEGGWRVGICGRTGGGKSTILKSLFRLMRPEPGYRLVVDGVEASRLKLKTLRQSMAIIPQEPVVFNSSVRYNLDPFGENGTDDDYWEALRGCHLEQTIRDRAAAENVEDPLNTVVTADNLSVGQRQLLCLGRALVLKKKILLLDEATANVDVVTDGLIQDTLRTKFQGVTQMVIAHRLNTIVDCDRIVVMDGGRVSQFDTYDNLIKDHEGIFRGLAEEAGLVSRRSQQ